MNPEIHDTRSTRLAALDVGSNSIRLVVAEMNSDGTYRVLDEEREMTRLGQGIEKTGRLSPEAMDRSLEAIGKMKAIADGFGVKAFSAIATSAVRDAANGESFCREVKRRHGVKLDVIKTDEEARLAFDSAARHFRLEEKLAAVVDIGGGSVEVILTGGPVIERVFSLPFGAVRVTEKYCRTDPLRRRDWRRLKRAVDRAIRDELGKPPFVPEVMVGSGGTFTTLAAMIRSQREGRAESVHGYSVTRDEIKALVRRLRRMPIEDRRKIPGLNPTRADIILAGAAVVSRLAKWLGTPQILVNERGIRDGLLAAMLGDAGLSPTHPKTGRMEAVHTLARKCGSHETHCDHVARLACMLFDQLQSDFDMPAEARDILEAATRLHDIGYLINHDKHHKHAYHLIMHGDLRGFSPREVELIANVARYHRRALPRKKHENFARLSPEDRRTVERLAGILRVADGLDRTHTQRVTGLHCRHVQGVLRVGVEAESDPHVEIWYAECRTELLSRALGGPIEFTWARPTRRRSAASGAIKSTEAALIRA